MVNKIIDVGAYYYPGWHKTGASCEWNLLKKAKPYFKGHYQPRVPLMGYLNDSEIPTLEKQIKLATSHGIDGFIFDWYWKRGHLEMEKSLHSFIKTGTDMKFSLTWSWKLPKRDLPSKLGVVSEAEKNRWVETSPEDFIKSMEYCAENYFKQDNFWHVEGKPYLVMYFIQGLVEKLGREGVKEMLFEGKKAMKKKRFDGLYIAGVVTEPFDAEDLGFDALTGYNFFPDFKPNSKIIQDYETQMNKRVKDWNTILQTSKLPYIPSISAGWDASSRGTRVEKLTRELDFPWVPIVTNNTPDKFGRFLNHGFEFISDKEPKIMHICAWNEWSEGAYLEPDTKFGYKYLEEVKKIKQKLKPF